MNLRFLETFVWLAKLRNFRMTAEKLHTTQAAVSSRLATLEQELGLRLFERGAGEVTLTLDGSKALVYAERLVRTMQSMRESMVDRSLYAGVVRIGVIESIIHSWLPRFVARIHESYPQLELELTGDTTLNLVERFGSGKLDLALQTDPILGPSVQNLPLGRMPMHWVASTRLGLHADILTIEDLAAYPILSFSRNSEPHKFVEALFAERVDGPARMNCMTSMAAMTRLVVDGFGVAMLPLAAIRRELDDGSLSLLRVDARIHLQPTFASFRAGPETPLFRRIAVIAQQVAHELAHEAPGQLVRDGEAT